MNQEFQSSYDVVIIGKGVSGLTAAMEASRHGASVAIVYDSQESATSLAYEGVFRLSDNSDDLKDKVIRYGGGLAKPELVSNFFKAYKDSLYNDLNEVFPLANAKPVGKKHRLGGPGILDDLENICRSSGVDFIKGKAVKICTSDNAVSAIQVFCFPRLHTYPAKAVVIATGGGIGNIYESTDNIKIDSTPGAILALNAGAKLRDVEFVSFHPLGVIDHLTYHNTMPIFTFFNIGVKTEIFSKNTDQRVDFIEDLISSRTAEKNAHDNIFQIAQEVWRNGGVYFYKGVRDNKQRYEVRVVAHSLNGGIDTNSKFETSVNGLYSAGEATGGLNGASRMPGMALLEGFMAGKQAGHTACEYANNNAPCPVNKAELLPAATRFGKLSSITGQTRKIADAAIFIERTGSDLHENKEKLLSLMAGITRKEIAQYIEYDVAEMVLAMINASILRKESRGFFYRKDYPDIDKNMEKSIIITKPAPDEPMCLHWEQDHFLSNKDFSTRDA